MTMNPVQTSPGAGAAAVFPGTYPAAEVAALAVENGEAERTTAHQERDAEEAAEAQANAAEVQAMHDEASSLRAQGYFDAATSVAGAVIGVACPAAAAGEKASIQSVVAGHASDGVEKLGDGFWKAAQHDDEANAAADKASAAQHADAAKDASDAAADASATISTAMEFDRNALSIESQTQLAALHRA
jgi:hypothetical protein